ncbi:DUF7836 family putative zinc-binding protein [Halopiger aswanensis]|uniref:DUF7836 domain-containing protein n=1 Tax=Halopiger aswanensis TaxID=148449 RepID=A0A3R7HI08_9EURY|nr:hypothetical protein [Halopiger aswanensis]RKD94704.1 hypothetical protein ATJ93_1543 [Halopiger aswanensis]
MREGWIDLECPDCGDHWEADPASLPSPGNRYTCERCESERPIAAFVKTKRGLDILESFDATSA